MFNIVITLEGQVNKDKYYPLISIHYHQAKLIDEVFDLQRIAAMITNHLPGTNEQKIILTRRDELQK